MSIYQHLLDKKKKISVTGLGYVGLPLALEFAKHFSVIGFDINADRVEMMKNGIGTGMRPLFSFGLMRLNRTRTTGLDAAVMRSAFRAGVTSRRAPIWNQISNDTNVSE